MSKTSAYWSFASTAVAMTTLAIVSMVVVGSISAGDQCVVTLETRYNDIQQSPATIPTIKRNLSDQLNRFSFRSVEIDIHGRNGAPRLTATGSCTTRHWTSLGTRSFTESNATVCLTVWRSWRKFHYASPSHEVVTVWLNVFTPPEPEILSRAIEKQIPRTLIWSPKELLSACPAAGDSLRDAIKRAAGPRFRPCKANLFLFLSARATM